MPSLPVENHLGSEPSLPQGLLHSGVAVNERRNRSQPHDVIKAANAHTPITESEGHQAAGLRVKSSQTPDSAQAVQHKLVQLPSCLNPLGGKSRAE